MREHSFRRAVVESSLSLPVMAFLTFLLWTATPKWDDRLWCTLFIVGAMTYVIVEWNNQCQLLRIRSRMNSVVFLMMVNMFPALHRAGPKLLPALCLLGAFFLLFKAYGKFKPEGYIFHAFFFISIGSLYYPPLLLLAIALFLAAGIQLRTLTLKGFSAALMGLILPYWLYAAAMFVKAFYFDGVIALTNPAYIEELFPITIYFSTDLPDYTMLNAWHWSSLIFVAVFGLVSVVHFTSTAYNDKIRTRQFFYTMLYTFVPVLLITAWWPDDIMYTLPLLLVNLTPFAAHYLALGKGRAMPYYFWMWFILAIAIGVANHLELWPLLTFNHP